MLLLLQLQAAAAPTTPGASASPDVWGIVGRVLTILGVGSSAALFFFWRAVLRALWCNGMTLATSDLTKLLDKEYAKDLAAFRDAVTLTGVHSDQIEALEASIEQQGIALRDSLTTAIQRQTESMERVADATAQAMQRIENTLERVHDEAAENTSAIAKVVGFLEGKGMSSTERRARPRKP